jgi:hypothetical protein
MQSLLHANAPKPFSPLAIPQQQSLLGNAPHGGRGMPINPFLNAAVFNRGPPRGVLKPHITPFKKPAIAPLHVNNGEISFILLPHSSFLIVAHTR